MEVECGPSQAQTRTCGAVSDRAIFAAARWPPPRGRPWRRSRPGTSSSPRRGRRSWPRGPRRPWPPRRRTRRGGPLDPPGLHAGDPDVVSAPSKASAAVGPRLWGGRCLGGHFLLFDQHLLPGICLRQRVVLLPDLARRLLHGVPRVGQVGQRFVVLFLQAELGLGLLLLHHQGVQESFVGVPLHLLG